ncbi:histone-fold-containing protein [Xylariaceae sp. FL1019]|nr:histone-fold-containing protein [Xylariaceae sp. FL1019]
MPYNTTAIPPRKEVTGQTQLPLSRVKKIIAQDQDINVCSNNAAFVITLATEMFVQYLAGEGLNMAKLERKPRRNIQYKDIANAVSHQDNLQFLEDMVPKTVPYKQIKAHAAATRANLTGGAKTTDGVAIASLEDPQPAKQSGRKQKSNGRANGGSAGLASFVGRVVSEDEDPSDQLRNEMRQASGDVHMSG